MKFQALQLVKPKAARKLLEQGGLAVDVRELHEHNAEHIAGDVAQPLGCLPAHIVPDRRVVIFYCNSGRRTALNADRLAATVKGRACQLQGGLNAWKEAGFPVEGGDPAAVAGANLLSQMLATFRKS
jgi:rhodanese-related sulfurtransferase